MYQDGIELELISRILGHSRSETTRIYAVPSIEMMRRVMESPHCGLMMKQKWHESAV